MLIKIQPTPTHIITGFLGAGKTTVLNHLLSQKPEGEIWAVLMNEFGEIGIDQAWVSEDAGIAVKEVVGGCLCCTSQLPMQIALARLLSEFKPTRLFIEPTGLGHPKELLDQLSQPHWQTSLDVRQVVTIIDGHRLNERLWEQYDIFLQQLDVADLVLISHQTMMNTKDHQILAELKKSYIYPQKEWIEINSGQIPMMEIDRQREKILVKKTLLLTQQIQRLDITQQDIEPKTLPYHYASFQQGFYVAGWHLSKSWCFDADRLLAVLQQLQHYERIKAKMNTTQGWVDINATARNFQIDFAAKMGLDNRLEIISHSQQNWQWIEENLLAAKEEC